jgi:peptide-methionine (S)-S-oxide reductase
MEMLFLKRCLLFTMLLMVVLTSCGERKSYLFKAPQPTGSTPGKSEAVATFAKGCYWHTEIVFQCLEGVRDAVSGYSAGAECVNVYYDTTLLSFKTLTDAFFASHDPTQLNRQGQDIGPQYRSVAFYRTTAEKEVIESKIAAINASGKYTKRLVTEVSPFSGFSPAEDDQQEYVAHHEEEMYVKYYNIPDYLKFRQQFWGPFKDSLIVR